MHLIDVTISRLQRFIQLTGIWHRRKLDICDIATVFIALQLVARRYIRYPTFLMNEFRKYVNFNPEACQLRMREFHRMTMDLAFYLPQIGKARFIPELLEPWNGRTTRPVPEAQLFVLLLPDVLENMQQLWEKRLHEIALQKDNAETVDVEARLKTALSAFLSDPEAQTKMVTPESEEREGTSSEADDQERSDDNTSKLPLGGSTPRASPLSKPKPPAHASSVRGALDASAIGSAGSSSSREMRAASSIEANLPQSILDSAFNHPRSDCTPVPLESLIAKTSLTRRKRKLNGISDNERMSKRVDCRSQEHRIATKLSVDEPRLRAATLDQLMERITTRRANDLVRQQSRQEIATGLLTPECISSARAAYGCGVPAESRRTRLPRRMPQVLRVLEEWQSAQLAGDRTEIQEPTPPNRSCYEYDAYWLKKDLLDGKAANSINIHRFPPSVTMAKAILHPFDFGSPVIGSTDDSLFEPGELESYLGDDEYTKCRLEVWHAQGMEEIATRRAAVSQRAMDIAAQRQPRIIGLRSFKRSQPNYDQRRMAELLVSSR